MFDNKTEKVIFLGKPDGIRKTGRSKSRWLERTENNLFIDGCQEMVEEGSREICMGYHSEVGTG
jgi:hypothetical protein